MERLERRVRCCKEVRSADLLSAARDVFVEKGFAAARLEDVAAKAGVSKGTVYLYFESKEALLQAVVESGLSRLAEATETLGALPGEADRPAIELLKTYFDAWRCLIADAAVASLPKLLTSESGHFPDVVHRVGDKTMHDARTILCRIIEAGIASGDFRQVPPGVIADLFFSAIWLSVTGHSWRGRPPPERLLEGIFEMLTHGLGGADSAIAASQPSTMRRTTPLK